MTERTIAPTIQSHVLSVPAATASLDTARRFVIFPKEGGEAIRLRSLLGRGFIATDVDVSVSGAIAEDVAYFMPPDLALRNIDALGDPGIAITVRNRRQAAISLVAQIDGRAILQTTTLVGAAITTPLSDVGSRPAHYDRNPRVVTMGHQGAGIAPHTTTIRTTYTVPAGKKTFIESASAFLVRDVVAGTPGRSRAYMDVTPSGGSGVIVAYAAIHQGTLGDASRSASSPLGTMFPGDVLRILSTDAAVGGSCEYASHAMLVEFDG